MTLNQSAYLRAAYPPGLFLTDEVPHLTDEEIAEQLERQAKRRRAARKGAETRKRRKEHAS